VRTLPASDEVINSQVNSEISEPGGVESSGFEANKGGALTYNSNTHAEQTP